MGSVLLTVTTKVRLAAPEVVRTKSELKPLSLGVQGEPKAPWTTEWAIGQNLKVRVSPWAAVVVLGSKVRPFLPTTMSMLAAWVMPMRARAVVVEKCILAVVLVLVLVLEDGLYRNCVKQFWL